jgi:hypothetical protein
LMPSTATQSAQGKLEAGLVVLVHERHVNDSKHESDGEDRHTI